MKCEECVEIKNVKNGFIGIKDKEWERRERYHKKKEMFRIPGYKNGKNKIIERKYKDYSTNRKITRKKNKEGK